MKKIRATVIGLATLIFASVLSFLPSRSVAAASINLDSYVSEPLNVMLNGDENGPIWTGNKIANTTKAILPKKPLSIRFF